MAAWRTNEPEWEFGYERRRRRVSAAAPRGGWLGEWRQDTSYGASSLVGDYTELWYGSVEATRNGSFISLNFTYPGDKHPRSLLLRAVDLEELVAAPHLTRRVLRGETYRSVIEKRTKEYIE